MIAKTPFVSSAQDASGRQSQPVLAFRGGNARFDLHEGPSPSDGLYFFALVDEAVRGRNGVQALIFRRSSASARLCL
jgi:hypothetical protein